ncbi:hypothetical protein [Amycolatopsis pigmentata]|uniref:Luciferase-like monooxygenase n=1 Tax=Amycolatopsis pigmentata TaxID=450801 RepID=A0ABW5G3E4_9PSEU
MAPPDRVGAERARLEKAATAVGRTTPEITISAMVAIHGDPSLPGHEAITRAVSDPDGMFGVPADLAESAVTSGGPEVIAEHLAFLADSGVQRVVVVFAAGDWFRQTDLLADAVRVLDGGRSSS